ncbi:MAG: hypothetical protein JWM47_3350 [Acidimicrobiales bacterium]|nr:hypothetical protein [Acidimicrobiales bacterium]
MTPDPDDTPIQGDLVAQGSGLPDDGEGEAAGGEPVEDPLAALLAGGSGGAGGLDFGALLEQASEMQSQMLAAQQEAAQTTVEGVAGGGVVRIAVTGGLDFQSVTIDPAAVDPADVEMLQDLVLAALHHAVEQLNDLQHPAIDLGGIDLGNIFGGS